MAGDRKKGQRLNGQDRADLRDKLVRDYKAGQSIRDLAVTHNISIGLSRNLLVESGIELRRRGGGRVRRVPS